MLMVEGAAILLILKFLTAGSGRDGVTGRRTVSVGSDKMSQSPVILNFVWMAEVGAILCLGLRQFPQAMSTMDTVTVPRLANVGMTLTKFHAKRKPVLTAEVSAIILVLRSLRAGYRMVGVTRRRSANVGSERRSQGPVILQLVWRDEVVAILLTPPFPTTLSWMGGVTMPRLASVGLIQTPLPAKRSSVLTAGVTAIHLLLWALRAGFRMAFVTGTRIAGVGSERMSQNPVMSRPVMGVKVVV